MTNQNQIQNQKKEILQDNCALLKKEGYEIMAVCSIRNTLFSSDGTAEENILAFIIPNSSAVLFGTQPENRMLKTSEETQIHILDYRCCFSEILKGNLSLIKALFTPNYILNPKYAEEFLELRAMAEDAAEYARIILANRLLSEAANNLSVYETKISRNEKDAAVYAVKILQTENLIHSYIILGKSFGESINSFSKHPKEKLMEVEKGNLYTPNISVSDTLSCSLVSITMMNQSLLPGVRSSKREFKDKIKELSRRILLKILEKES